MSANNENIEMIVEAEYVPEIVATAVEELPITLAELLEEDFGDDDEAEFLQGVLEIQEAIENVILSDRPEDFLLPTPDDLPPALLLLEKLDELKGYKFADRTLARMERRIRGENELVRTFVSESDKINNPAYKKCPLCERHFTIRYLGRHIGNEVCKKVSVAHILRPSTNDKKKVSDKIYAACLDLEDLIARSNEYKRNIMGLNKELEEEVIEEEEVDILTCESCNEPINDKDKYLQQQLENEGFCDDRADANCINCWKNFMEEMIADGNTAEEWEKGLYVVDEFIKCNM